MIEPELSSWLAMREAVDAAARSEAVTQAVIGVLPQARPLRILDLGAGGGSNIRFLAPRLPGPQQWTAVDRDSSLLAHVPPQVETRRLELGRLDDPALFAGVHLVTASALLDLASADWIGRLAECCQRAGAAALFALNYNGFSRCSPADPDDEFVLVEFNRHQRQSDKGFGVAAGPAAGDAAVRAFAGRGYEVRQARSDWQLNPDMRGLQAALIGGWAHAALEIAPAAADRIRDWHARRIAHVRAGQSHTHVGHVDVAAWPVR